MPIVDVAIPITDTYIRRKCRNIQSRSGWWKTPVEIEAVAAANVSIAYQVVRPGANVMSYDIIAYKGRLWWQVFPPHERDPLSVDYFTTSACQPTGYFGATMEFPAELLEAAHGVTAEQLDAELWQPLRFRASTRQDEYVRAQREVSRILFCGDIVYREGGPPCYFAYTIRVNGMRILVLRVGSLHVGWSHPHAWHHVPPAEAQRSAALATRLLDIDEVDFDRIAAFREQFHDVVTERILTARGVTPEIDATRYCADTMARAVLEPRPEMAGRYHLAMESLRTRVRSDRIMPSELSRQIIRAGLQTSLSTERDFGITRWRALAMVEKLETDEAIASLLT